MQSDLRICVQATLRWLSMIWITFCPILTLQRLSSVCFIAVDVACLCRVASTLKWIFHFSSFMKGLNMRRTSPQFCDDMIGSQYPNFGLNPIAFGRPTKHLQFARCFDYWAPDCDCKLRLRLHVSGIFASWHNARFSADPLSHRSSHYVEARVDGYS